MGRGNGGWNGEGGGISMFKGSKGFIRRATYHMKESPYFVRITIDQYDIDVRSSHLSFTPPTSHSPKLHLSFTAILPSPRTPPYNQHTDKSPNASSHHLLPHPSVSTLLIDPMTSTPSNSSRLLRSSILFPLSASSISILLLSRLRLLGTS